MWRKSSIEHPWRRSRLERLLDRVAQRRELGRRQLPSLPERVDSRANSASSA